MITDRANLPLATRGGRRPAREVISGADIKRRSVPTAMRPIQDLSHGAPVLESGHPELVGKDLCTTALNVGPAAGDDVSREAQNGFLLLRRDLDAVYSSE
jgi:hypothetical protein